MKTRYVYFKKYGEVKEVEEIPNGFSLIDDIDFGWFSYFFYTNGIETICIAD